MHSSIIKMRSTPEQLQLCNNLLTWTAVNTLQFRHSLHASLTVDLLSRIRNWSLIEVIKCEAPLYQCSSCQWWTLRSIIPMHSGETMIPRSSDPEAISTWSPRHRMSSCKFGLNLFNSSRSTGSPQSDPTGREHCHIGTVMSTWLR